MVFVGAIELILIPYFAKSIAADFKSPIANLDEQYATYYKHQYVLVENLN